MKIITRAALAATLSLGIIALAPVAAQAADFYWAGKCSVDPGGYARLSVTNYDKGTGQEYHIDMNSVSSPVRYSQLNVRIDGVLQNKTENFYKYYSSQATGHTIQGIWVTSSGVQAKCSLYH